MRAFVTGSTGLLGNNLVRLLIKEGYHVKALARSREKAQQALSDTNAEIVVGDMNDVDAFADALAGSDVLFHTAAYFRETFTPGDHWPTLERINITNTIRLFEIAERQGVAKIVHTSSISSIGQRADGRPSDETVLASEHEARDLYARSKTLGDRAIAAFLQQHTIPVMSILPAWMFGPHDAAPTGGGQFVLDYLNRRLPGVMDSGIDVVDARDVALAAIAAATRGRHGERYIVTARHASQADLCAVLEQVSGIPAPTRQIPIALAFAAAWATERIATLTGRESSLSVNGVRAITRKKRTSAAKAIEELGVTFRPLVETMRDTVRWYAMYQPEHITTAARQQLQSMLNT
jgi:dihydroflavonol-4-reductase